MHIWAFKQEQEVIRIWNRYALWEKEGREMPMDFGKHKQVLARVSRRYDCLWQLQPECGINSSSTWKMSNSLGTEFVTAELFWEPLLLGSRDLWNFHAMSRDSLGVGCHIGVILQPLGTGRENSSRRQVAKKAWSWRVALQAYWCSHDSCHVRRRQGPLQ